MARILVSDDEPVICRVLDRFLSGLGHEVATLPEGRGILSLVEETRPDVLIADVDMRYIDGSEILDGLSEQGQRISVIAMSGRGGLEQAVLSRAATALRAVVPLAKPFSLTDLSVALELVLAAA